MRMARLHFVFLVLAFSSFGYDKTVVSSSVVRFKKFNVHRGFTCAGSPGIFDMSGISSSTQCIIVCDRIPSCIGVIYGLEPQRCVGCQWHTNDGPLEELGPSFYSREDPRVHSMGGVCEAYRLVTDNMNWWEAKVNCESIGGRLADIKSQDEQTFIENNILPSAVNLYWVGGRDNSSGFAWLDGSAISTGYNYWNPGQPSQSEGSVEYCTMLYQRQDNATYTWDDAPCQSENFVIGSVCEFD